MDILDNLPLLKIFKPKNRRTIKICLGLAAIAFPGFGAWLIGHAVAHRQALTNAAGTYLTSGLVRSMNTLKLAPTALPAPAQTVPAADNSHTPLVLTVPGNAHGGR